MAATDAKSILALAACDACFSGNQFEAQLVMIGLLRIIAKANNAMAATDAKSILANSACDAECGMQLPLVITGLLRIIAQSGGGGGGGGGQIVAYTGVDPNTQGVTPPTPANPAIAVKPGSPIYTWTTPAGPWV